MRSVLSLYADAAKLEALGRHAQDYINLFATIKHAEEAPQPTSGDENRFELALRAAVTMESVMHLGGAGGLKRRGTVIWRNQAGPNETCQRSGGAKASGADGSADQAADFMTLCDPDCLAPYTNVPTPANMCRHKCILFAPGFRVNLCMILAGAGIRAGYAGKPQPALH